MDIKKEKIELECLTCKFHYRYNGVKECWIAIPKVVRGECLTYIRGHTPDKVYVPIPDGLMDN